MITLSLWFRVRAVGKAVQSSESIIFEWLLLSIILHHLCHSYDVW